MGLDKPELAEWQKKLLRPYAEQFAAVLAEHRAEQAAERETELVADDELNKVKIPK